MGRIQLQNGIVLWYNLIGNGPLLVLNHGYGSSHKSLQYVANYLKNNFTCLLWDERGQGDSDKPLGISYEETRKSYTIEQFADDLYNVLKSLNYFQKDPSEKIFMYGHSMGGMISLMYAVKYGNTLKKLAVGSTSANMNNLATRKILDDYKRGFMPTTEEEIRMNATIGFTRKFRNEHPEFIEMLIEDKLKVPKDIMLAMFENFILNYDLENELTHLKIPVLILHGKRDNSISSIQGEKLHKLIPNSEIEIFPKQNHEINKEIPKEVAEKIKEFFFRE